MEPSPLVEQYIIAAPSVYTYMERETLQRNKQLLFNIDAILILRRVKQLPKSPETARAAFFTYIG